MSISLAPVAGVAAVQDEVCCAHCALPVPAGYIDPDAAAQFCCAGCRTAFALLHEHGLGAYYALAERQTTPVAASGRSYDEFDHADFHARYVRAGEGGLARVQLALEGVHCASCLWLVERVPLIVAGVARAELNVTRSLASIEWDPNAVALSQVARTLAALGYPPHPYHGTRVDDIRQRDDRRALARIGIAGAVAMNVMLASLALYSGWFSDGLDASMERFFRWVSFALTVPVVAGPGRVFLTGAWAALRTGGMHLDLPIAIALTAGTVRGAINTITDSGPVYFDGVALLVFLLLVGRYLQRRGERAANDASELLSTLTPSGARIVGDDGAIRELPASALVPGMTLDVRPGDTVAADGVVTGGTSQLDLSLLTGESRPVRVADGDAVFAGTLNVSAPLRVCVERSGDDSRVARLLQQVEESGRRRAPVVILANRLAGAFVAVVIVLAALTVLFWFPYDRSAAIDHAIALLVVTCPCALAMATPLAMTVAIGRASRRGILIKGGAVVESLARPGVVILDKTGTITEGRTALVEWHGPEWAKPLILALERDATHPVAGGFCRAFEPLRPAVVTSVQHVVGGGVMGCVDGRQVVVGSPPFVASRVPGAGGLAALLRDPSLTPVVVAVDGIATAVAGFGDPIRADAAASVERLRRMGWTVEILSGDAPTVVQGVAAALSIPLDAARGGVSPEDKLRHVEALRQTRRVVMVGDGVNDAAAIAAATVGIGVHGGAEASLATADVHLARPGLSALAELLDGARRAMFVVRRNIVMSLIYNVAGVGLAIAGVLSPVVAAVLMPVSSLTVVLLSWHGRTFARTP